MAQHSSPVKERIQADMKTALKGGEKARLGAIRLILAAIQQREIDERIDLTDEQVFAVLDKMLKQRRESEAQYRQAHRGDLADQEAYEISLIQTYLPTPLAEGEIVALVREAIAEVAATSLRDMGKVMAVLRPKVQGRTDMAAVSARVKVLLGTQGGVLGH